MTDKAPQSGAATDEVVFMPLGGAGEIGMNVYLYGIGPQDDRQWLMLDLGLTFPGVEEPGVDVILPDLTFVREEKAALAGLVITHAHEDHIGAVIELWPSLQVPVYATPFAAGMLRAKLNEFGAAATPDIHEIKPGARQKIGRFDIELVDMSHSIPETSAIAMRTGHGIILHTADWKLDPEPYVGNSTDIEKLKALGKEGITALICDSTNAMRDGRSPSEAEIAASLAKIVKDCPRRVCITTFSSNVARIKAIADAATATGRTFVVAGRALHRVIQVAIDTGYLPEDFTYHDQDSVKSIPAANVLLLVTGSQGEGRAALARIADDDHPTISLDPGDAVIYSSRTIPGNEKSVLRVQNKLADMGVSIITDNDALVHVTGHPRRDELKEMFEWTSPKLLVPMHGESRHLQENAKLAKAAGIKSVPDVRNGKMVRLAPNGGTIIDEAPTGRLYRDGKLIIPEGEGSVRERRKLAHVGIIFVSVVTNEKGDVIADPDATLDGVPFETHDGSSMEDLVLDTIDATVEGMNPKRRRDPDALADSVKRAVRNAVDQVWRKRPIVKVLVSVVERKR